MASEIQQLPFESTLQPALLMAWAGALPATADVVVHWVDLDGWQAAGRPLQPKGERL